MPFERIRPPSITWGETLCSRRRCAELAVLLLDGWPFCIECADEELDRELALGLNPEAVAMMPALEDR